MNQNTQKEIRECKHGNKMSNCGNCELEDGKQKEWDRGQKEMKCNHFMAWNIQSGYSYYRCSNCNFIDGEKTFSQQREEIIKEIEEALPKEQEKSHIVSPENEAYMYSLAQFNKVVGYNQALQQITQAIKKVGDK